MDTFTKATTARLQDDTIPSSSPAFGTPVHPINPHEKRIPRPVFTPAISTILPILLPPPSLRPLAFRTFTKKHNLTLSSPALQSLATFIGKHCGSGWRERGTAEGVLEEVAKGWKKSGGSLIVNDAALLKTILKALEASMSGGKVVQSKGTMTRQASFVFADSPHLPSRPAQSPMQTQDPEEDEEIDSRDPRAWIKVVGAFEQPRLSYNVHMKHFEKVASKPTLLPSPHHKTQLFRDRYNLIHQRLLRNEAFQAPSVSQQRALKRSDSTSVQQFYKITPIANLLGRNASSHVLLGMLVITPTGTVALNDLTGSITLDLQHAKPLQGEDSAWYCPGMIVLIEGVYEEEYAGAGASGLGASTGVGGTIGGKFITFSIGGPPTEKRNLTLGISDPTTKQHQDVGLGGGFGWTDFLGLGSDKALGTKMRRLEKRLLGSSPDQDDDNKRRKIIILSEVNLDHPSTLEALRAILRLYASEETETPLCFMLIGNFVSHPVMSGGDIGGSIEYKEYFNDLATILSDFPSLLQTSTWVFVPGDNDPWASAFSAGASTTVPRNPIPALFTSRIKRAFANANEHQQKGAEEPIWTTNPSRLTLFGPAHEVVVFRDDISSRFRRTALSFGKATRQKETDNEEQEEQDQDTEMQDDTTTQSQSQTLETTQQPESQSQTQETTQQPESQAQEMDASISSTSFARKLILSLLPQSHLSPFPLHVRPILWDQNSSLSLYPLPHTLILADSESPAFAVTFEGCHVLNPGRLCREEGRRNRVTWVEYDGWSKRGKVRGIWN